MTMSLGHLDALTAHYRAHRLPVKDILSITCTYDGVLVIQVGSTNNLVALRRVADTLMNRHVTATQPGEHVHLTAEGYNANRLKIRVVTVLDEHDGDVVAATMPFDRALAYGNMAQVW